MDDIRIVFYVVAGIIFIVSRVIKANKSANNPQRKPAKPNQAPEKPLPSSLEDMLKEFGQKVEKETIPNRPVNIPVKEENREFVSGTTRRFADDESRKVYEDSIKRAEGFDIKFEEDSNFKGKRTKFGEGAIKRELHQKNPLIEALKNDLKNPESAKKAVILSEILNRKY